MLVVWEWVAKILQLIAIHDNLRERWEERKKKKISLCCYWFLNDGERSREIREGKLVKKKGKKDLKREKWGKRHCIEREGKRGNNRRVKWLREAHRKKNYLDRTQEKIFLCSKCSKFKQDFFHFIFSCFSSVISDKIEKNKIK